MQFVVFMELIGTVVLPVAICLTYTLVINYAFNPPTSFSDAIPLLLLGGVLGLPAMLIIITSGKIVYLLWMVIYLLALPVWNFILPVYAFWHFDDFSWGETRKVQGEGKEIGHAGDGGQTIEVNAVPLRRWDAWEKSRLRKAKRDEKRRTDFQRAFGSAQFHNGPDGLRPIGPFTPRDSSMLDGDMGRYDSETASFISGEEDRWGLQIGHYSVDGPSHVPPPVGLFAVNDTASIYGAPTVAHDQMTAMLDEGWDDEDETSGDAAAHYQPVLSYSPNPNSSTYNVLPHSPGGLKPNFQTPSTSSHSSQASSENRPLASSTAVESWQGHAKRRSGGAEDVPNSPRRGQFNYGTRR